MRPYEEILNKISPVFFKLKQYSYNYDMGARNLFTVEYLEHTNIPAIIDFHLPKKAYYAYNAGYSLELSKIGFNSLVVVRLLPQHKLPYYPNFSYPMFIGVEFIVNMVINKFSIENEEASKNFVECSCYEPNIKLKLINLNFRDYFIALVGIDTYEIIKRNIK